MLDRFDSIVVADAPSSTSFAPTLTITSRRFGSAVT